MDELEAYLTVLYPLIGGVIFVFALAYVLDLLEEKYWK